MSSKIEFIIPHNLNRRYKLICQIASLIAQTDPNWSLHVICDGPNPDIDFLKIVFPESQFPNIKYSVLDRAYNDWGHTPRNIGVQQCNTEWVVMASNDNYYVPIFVEQMRKAINSNPSINFLYCDMIHNGYSYNHIRCLPKIERIDMCNMVVRTKFAKQVPLKPSIFAADAIFCEEYVKKFCTTPENIHYFPHIYYVHN